MPSSYSFDVVSEFDQQELVNAIDQLRREVDQRYDLKDSKTKIDIKEDELSIVSLSEMTIESVKDILLQKATKRNLSLKIFEFQKIEAVGGNMVKQRLHEQQRSWMEPICCFEQHTYLILSERCQDKANLLH